MAQYSFERLRDEYDRLWAGMRVIKTDAATKQARQIIAHKDRYQTVERETTVPWFVVGCLHMRESNANFNTYLGNGQPLNRKTTIVPKGRGPFPDFETGAKDALHIDRLDEVTSWTASRVAYSMECFNGFGYRSPSRNIPSPYLWGGTSVQKPGKFVRDGVYDASVMDPQIGGMAVLKQIMALDASARFDAPRPTVQEPPPPIVPEEVPPSPRADDEVSQVKPLTKSTTIWGGIGQWLTTAGMSVFGWLQGIPWQVVVACLLVGSVALYLVITGRLNVQKIIKHLSNDDEAAT